MIKKKFKQLQKLIDQCVKHDYDVLEKALLLKKDYLSAEQRPDYIRKEIFRITEELVSMNQQVPALRTFAFDWHIPNFIWESSYCEHLTPVERNKYVNFSYESFDDKQYFDNSTSYDNVLPHFSVIVKLVVYSKYLENLKGEERERLSTPATSTNIIAESKEQNLPRKILGKENPFNCNLNKDAIRLLTDCINDVHIFTTEITPEILDDFLYCRLNGALKSSNNRLLAYFMTKLSINEFITYEWQSVIANNKLILAPKKEKYLNSSDLSTANDNIKYTLPKKSEIIDNYIKQLKKH